MNQHQEAEVFGKNWAEKLSVPYQFPERVGQDELSGLSGIGARLKYLFYKQEVERPTGLEHFPREDFVKEAYRHDIFHPTRESAILMTSNWDYMLDPENLRLESSRPFMSALRKELRGQNIIELGAGERGADHEKIFKGIFRVASYTAVDIREEVVRSGGVQDDALQYLMRRSDQSAVVVAFGLFNEPLSPINLTTPLEFMWPASSPERATRRQWEQEYLRRLAREIGRVTPNGGILFGDGLHPIDANFDFDRYLQGSGFRHDAALYTTLAKSYDIMARSPFIFKKTEN